MSCVCLFLNVLVPVPDAFRSFWQLLNRRDLIKSMKNQDRSELNFHDISSTTDAERRQLLDDSTPMVYICATMWHENEQEMIYMLKSIFRCEGGSFVSCDFECVCVCVCVCVESLSSEDIFKLLRRCSSENCETQVAISDRVLTLYKNGSCEITQ